MCREASMVVMRDRVYWDPLSDSHEKIISAHNLSVDGVRGPNGVRVEIVPEDRRFDSDPASWKFAVDQDLLPEWWDAEDAERRVRLELLSWIRHKVVKEGHRVVTEGTVFACGSASVEASGSASVEARGSASVKAWGSASVKACGGVLQAYGVGCVEIKGTQTVAIDLRKDVAVCYVGTEELRRVI